LFSATAYAQNESVSGQVKDDAGAPLQGAVVAVKGSRTAVTTSENGMFTIKAPQGVTLVISHVGYADKEILVEGSMLNIAMSHQARQLDEIVVTALGIKKAEKALSYAVTQVKGSDLTETRTVNIANSLEGKVAGLNIAAAATGPGGSTRITLRGSGSISGNNQPLLVVDGIPYNNDQINNQIGGAAPGASAVGMWGGVDQGDGISTLNPDDIESITVLKGGTAAALYGSRASNGALIVTTKSGSKANNAVGIEFSSNFQAERLLYSHFNKDYQYQYGIGDLPNTTVANPNPLQGVAPTAQDGNPNFQTDSYGAPLDGSEVIQYDGVSRPYVAQKNNMNNFFQTGTTETNSIGFGTATDKLAYHVAISDLRNTGILPGNTLKRDNASLNLNGTLSKWFSFIANIKYTAQYAKNRPVASDSPGNADYSLFTLPTSLNVKNLQPGADSAGNERIYTNNIYVDNPYFVTQKIMENDTKDRIFASFQPKINITDWLYVKGLFGVDQYSFQYTKILPTGTAWPANPEYTRNLDHFTEANYGWFLGVDKAISHDLTLNAFVGGNAMTQSILINNTTTSTNSFNIPFFYDISNVNPGSITQTDGDYEKRINSLFGSVDLSWKNQLFLNITGRNDWFSALTAPTGNSKNSIFYPSIGLSYVLSDALRMPAWVNYLKVRGSWAQVGGDTQPYQLANYYGLNGAGGPSGSTPLASIGPSQVPNAHLQPYASLSDEVGAEGRLFNSRLGFDVAYYNHNNRHDIVSATVPPPSGYTSAIFNVGKIANKGVEVMVSYRFGNKFTYEPGLNFAYNDSRIVQLYQGLNTIIVDNARTQTADVSQVVGQHYDELQVQGYQRNSAGQIINASTGLPLAATAYTNKGTGVSPFTTGLNNNFHYKHWSLNVLVDAKFGGVIFDGDEALAYRYGLAKKTLPGRLTGIVAPGVGPDGKTPNSVLIAAETYYTNDYNFGEPFVYSTDFIKLRSVQLDYSFPAAWFGNSIFKGASLSVVGRNLWTIMKHTPIIDPESTYNNGNAQGLEFASAPATRTLGLNLNVKF
jgi:TonB-linked SusC/RagA family outer membrane protein